MLRAGSRERQGRLLRACAAPNQAGFTRLTAFSLGLEPEVLAARASPAERKANTCGRAVCGVTKPRLAGSRGLKPAAQTVSRVNPAWLGKTLRRLLGCGGFDQSKDSVVAFCRVLVHADGRAHLVMARLISNVCDDLWQRPAADTERPYPACHRNVAPPSRSRFTACELAPLSFPTQSASASFGGTDATR